jgi:mevalonate kinase
MVETSAPGKLILCGEHAVVYHQPAIAVPLSGVRAWARVEATPPGSGIIINAADLGKQWTVADAPDNPLSELALATFRNLEISPADLTITLTSTIPIAGGMGSGAAVATALVRGLVAWAGHRLPPAELSALVYRCEQRYHGTPSGIDNTVIAYERPIWFVHQPARKKMPLPPTIEPISLAEPLTLVIGDTGKRCETRLPVGEVRRRWQADPQRYEPIFAQVGRLVERVRDVLAEGDIACLGPMLNTNQTLLEQMGVSSPELEHLIEAARGAGATGAKLSGGGGGGVMLSLVNDATSDTVAEALRRAGSAQVYTTRVERT